MSYHSRAMRHKDRRYARIFERMGYGTREMRKDEGEDIRELYRELFGRAPHHTWDDEKIQDKIDERLAD